MSFTEDVVEQAVLTTFEELGWVFADPNVIGPDGSDKARPSYSDVVLIDRLRAAAARINPDLPADAIEDALKQVMPAQTPSLIEENRRIHTLIVRGVDVEFKRPDGSVKGEKGRPSYSNTPGSFSKIVFSFLVDVVTTLSAALKSIKFHYVSPNSNSNYSELQFRQPPFPFN